MNVPLDPPGSGSSLERAELYVAAEEGVANRLTGVAAVAVLALAAATSIFHLYAAYSIVPTQLMRLVHVSLVLVLVFVTFPVAVRFRDRIQWWDLVFATAAVGVAAYVFLGGDDFNDRNTLPTQTDIAVGIIFIALVLEGTRRATGWIMPTICLGFIVYALSGPLLPPPWTHRGYGLDRLTGHLYMTLEGIFGTAVDVSSSLIILFSIYGAALQHSGAGKFFIDFSFAATGGKRASAGRTVVLASFLLGGPSGSGVATTVTIGSVAAPLLAKAGFSPTAAGGLLAAGGLGAILSPPVLGAAAFLIAEFLKISYLDVIRMAVIPTCLYYASLLLMVEFERKTPLEEFDVEPQSLWHLATTYWFHFLSLITIVVFMVLGSTPVRAVFWATILTIAVSFLRRDSALYPRKLVHAIADGTTRVLNVAATCAAAGIIVGVVTLTGLGLKFSAIAIAYAGGSLLLTALYTALIVWIVGLAVPVTASYIITAVIAAPALIQLGVPDFAAHMFIFYYALLSEVSPPTALSPFAAAAITGGNPYVTTMQAWKYTLPAFVVPFVFVLDPLGVGLLLKLPAGADWGAIAWLTIAVALGIATFAAALQGRLPFPLHWLERTVLVFAGVLLLFPHIVQGLIQSMAGPFADGRLVGLVVAAVVAFTASLRWRSRKVLVGG
ncbi:MAG: TRAP transporter fused permease subunit [Alphaproteobacteria bacterium]|nr:TRAP transporter fused permease subunit [Alphaproteobacteria bacterium]